MNARFLSTLSSPRRAHGDTRGPPRAEIESALERAEKLVESIEARSLSPRILEMRGRVARALGDAPASDRDLREALDLYRSIGAMGRAERLARELAS